MKRLFLTIGMLALVPMLANAQKTVKEEKFTAADARLVEVVAKSYVRPLVVDLVVPKGQKRKIYSRTYSRSEVEIALGGNLDNLRSRVLYDATSDWDCDAVVAATFKIELLQDGTGYGVEMKGFPANFDPDSWHSMSQEDFQWMEIEKWKDSSSGSGAVIEHIRK